MKGAEKQIGTQAAEVLATRPLFDPPEHDEPERIIARAKLPTDFCKRCEHPRSDHKVETEKKHPHFRTGIGDAHPHYFPTKNRDPYCHLPLCTCMWFVETAEELELPNMPQWWLKHTGQVTEWCERHA